MGQINIRKTGNSVGRVFPKEWGLTEGDIITYSRHFSESLAEQIGTWETELFFPERQITRFVVAISNSLELLKTLPHTHEDITERYGFDQPPFRILIGRSHGIFYRVNEDRKEILVGGLFHQKQMRLKF